jgi:Ca2+-transporting ATPase
MITGDDPGTARAIGAAVGLPSGRALTGADLARLGDDELRAELRDATICARVLPDQKLRIVRALQADGEVVAMTGDGINDAPALKAAQVGVAMGGRGTDVAREAAAIVLTRDDFTDLVAGIAEGRRIFDNLRKAFGFIIAVHVPIAGIALVPLLFSLPMLLHPIHIVFLELIIDPACSVAFEAEAAEPDLMRRPPHPQGAPLLDRRTMTICFFQGLCVLAACLAALYVSHVHVQQPFAIAQTLTFATLVFADLGLILVHRSSTTSMFGRQSRSNRALWGVLLGSLTVLVAVLQVPLIRSFFGFAPVPALQWIAWAVVGLASVLWFNLLKLGRARPAAA